MNDDFRNYFDEKFSALATKVDGISGRLDGLSEDLDSLAAITKRGFDGVDKRFDQVDVRLDHIENLLIRDLVNRIERLEDHYRELATAVGK